MSTRSSGRVVADDGGHSHDAVLVRTGHPGPLALLGAVGEGTFVVCAAQVRIHCAEVVRPPCASSQL